MTKLGPGVINPTAEALSWARRAPIVKAMDRVEPLEAAPPTAIRLFRASAQNENDTTDPVGRVNQTIAALKGYKHPELYLQLWTGAHPTQGQLVAAVEACHVRGYKTVGSSWFTGDYTIADWKYATVAGVDMYAPQCYWGTKGFTLDHAVRYRRFWQWGQAPVVIAECGRDAVEGGKGGYYRCSFTDAQIVADLEAYDREIDRDTYVFGATPFTCGPTPDWQAKGFNLDPVAHILGYEGGGNVPVTTQRKYTHGADISSNNGPISDWEQVARCIDFIEIKVNEYDYTNPLFAESRQAAYDHGLVVILYDFARPSLGSGHDEAQKFLDRVGTIRQGDIPMLDMEDMNVHGDADLLAYVVDWKNTVKAAWGATPMLYSADWYLKPHNLEGHPELAECGLNYASYTVEPPTVPAPWGTWAIWQYSDKGTMPGMIKAVDLDLFNGTVEQLRKYGKP